MAHGIPILKPPIKKESQYGITKCKYCGRKYNHSKYGPIVELFFVNEFAWEPKIETHTHNSRLPFQCGGCGGNIMLNVKKLVLNLE